MGNLEKRSRQSGGYRPGPAHEAGGNRYPAEAGEVGTSGVEAAVAGSGAAKSRSPSGELVGSTVGERFRIGPLFCYYLH